MLIGDNSYEADVVVGIRNDGKLEFYDLVSIVPRIFVAKKKRGPQPVKLQNANTGDKGVTSSVTNSMQETDENVKEKLSVSSMTTDRIDYLISDSGAGMRKDYAQKWITSISPTDFLNMTLGTKNQNRAVFDKMPGEYGSTVEGRDFVEDLRSEKRQTPYLAIDAATGKVVGHEGRHRMRALEKQGIEEEITADHFTYFMMQRTNLQAIAEKYFTQAELAVGEFDRLMAITLSVWDIQKNIYPEFLSDKETMQKASEISNRAIEAVRGNKKAASKETVTRLSINPNFEGRYNEWINSGKPSNYGYFVLGSTSDALISIGVNPAKIRWYAAKINTIQEKHPWMTDDVVKQVPKMLEDPILVMQSVTVANRIVVMGDVVIDGIPVVAALEIRPNGEIKNFVVVASAYERVSQKVRDMISEGRDISQEEKVSNIQNLINTSDILYVDPNENRTNNWLSVLRLQLPAEITQYGPIGRVTYTDVKVNKDGSKTIKDPTDRPYNPIAYLLEKAESEEKLSVSPIDSEGRTLTEAQQEFFKDSEVRDADGNLMVMYHGTDAEFTVFEKKKGTRSIGILGNYEVDTRGFFFSSDYDFSSKYGRKVKPYYLDVKKPLLRDADKVNLNNLDETGKTAFYDEERVDELYYILEPAIKDILDYQFEYTYSLYDDTEENVKLKKRWALKDLWEHYDGDIFQNMSLPWEVIDNTNFDECLSRMKKLGYDGFMVSEGDDNPNSWFVLNSNQAKLTSNKNPTSDPDIRYSVGSIRTKKSLDAEVGEDQVAIDDDIIYDDEVGSAARFSAPSWQDTDYVTKRDETIQVLVDRTGQDAEVVEKWMKDIDSVAAIIFGDYARYGYESNPLFSPLKTNSEYKYTIDFSTLCKKRKVFNATYDAIQQYFRNTVLTAEDFVRIREMLKERKYEVACGICYVESTRKDISRITQQFIEAYREAYDGQGYLKFRGKKRYFVEEGYVPELADLNTVDGIGDIQTNHPLVWDAYLAFMNARGMQKPKLLETVSEYTDQILAKYTWRGSTSKTQAKVKTRAVDAMNRRGGLRLQSYSDFEVAQLIDMMQVVLDMATVGLKSQAYTKVPEFAALMGMTGVKINLSLIAKGDGIDENGNLIFDGVEGMDFDTAMKLRDAYSKNVGTILVGKNDAHSSNPFFSKGRSCASVCTLASSFSNTREFLP